MSIPPILVVAIKPVDRFLLQSLEKPIAVEFDGRVELYQGKPLDGSFSFDVSRNQYGSTQLLAALLDRFNGYEGKILGVTSGDLFVPVLTYVFGEAQLEGKVAVVSSHRLRDEFYGLPRDEGILRLRLAKEAIHEIGHTLGLLHCANYSCVMHSSTTVDEIDLKTDNLCPACLGRIVKGDR